MSVVSECVAVDLEAAADRQAMAEARAMGLIDRIQSANSEDMAWHYRQVAIQCAAHLKPGVYRRGNWLLRSGAPPGAWVLHWCGEFKDWGGHPT